MSLRGRFRLAVVFALAATALILMAPLQLVLIALKSRHAGALPVVFHRLVTRLFGVRVHLTAPLPADRPLLIVANHMSWLDIPVLSTLAPMSFVAKADMATWPLFGWLARMQRTIFVAREDRRKAGAQADEIAERLAAREIIVLFPEGTTSDGNALLPLKTPLFEAAKLALAKTGLEQATVLPVALRYDRLHGLPVGRAERAEIAWPGEIGLGENLLPLVAKGALDVTVHCGPPLHLDAQSNRKVIAAQAANAIRHMR